MRRLLRRLPKSGLKFAAYVVVCLLLLVGLAARIGNIHFLTHRTAYQAELTDATGLRPGDDVKIAGVTVGQVSSITTRHGLALVSFAVNRDVKVPAATRVGLRWQNVLGLKYLYLYPTAGGPYLAAGATIPASQDEADADIGAFLNALGPILRSIDPAEANAFVAGVLGGLQGNEAKVSSLIDNAATVSQTVGDLNVQVGRVIDNLSAVMGALGGRSADLQQVVSNLATISGSLASRNDVLDSVVENFSKASGEFASLISTNRSNLDTAISSLNTIAGTLAQNRQGLDADLTTLTEGLQPYRLISSYGQWFNVATVYQCMANQQSCNYQEGGPKPGSPGTSSSTAASPALPAPAPAPTGTGLDGLLRQIAGGR
ncbi:MAG TPA: MCE family protein [Acidimicrobiales bacterium]|nr:MCE family protein [Acidimicrobiales bacterium]